MSVSPHRCRKQEAQGFPRALRYIIFSKDAFRRSGSGILFQAHISLLENCNFDTGQEWCFLVLGVQISTFNVLLAICVVLSFVEPLKHEMTIFLSFIAISGFQTFTFQNARLFYAKCSFAPGGHRGRCKGANMWFPLRAKTCLATRVTKSV
jgi:hypothetical protein